MTSFRDGVYPIPEGLREQEPVDPYTFVECHARLLDESARSWQDTEVEAGKLKADYVARVGASGFYDAVKDDEPELYEFIIDLAAQGLIGVIVNTARYYAATGKKPPLTVMNGLVKNISDEETRFLITGGEGGRIARAKGARSIAEQLYSIHGSMSVAEVCQSRVLTNFVALYSSAPSSIARMAELYKDEAASFDARFLELRRMVRTDWFRPDREESILRNFVCNLSANPMIFATRFVNGVINNQNAGSEQRLIAQFAHLAHAAICACVQGVPDISDRDALLTTYDTWPELEVVQKAFDKRIIAYTREIEESIAIIAGPEPKRGNARYPVSERQHTEYLQSVNLDTIAKDIIRGMQPSPSGLQRPRKRQRSGNPAAQRPVARPTEQLVEFDENDKPAVLDLYMLRRGDGKSSTVEVPVLESLYDKHGIGVGNGRLQTDIAKVIAYLQTNPIGPASVRIRSGNHTEMYIDGGLRKLWRCAPEDAQGVNVHPDNRYYRVVYTLDSKQKRLIIVDILPHNEFDKKY